MPARKKLGTIEISLEETRSARKIYHISRALLSQLRKALLAVQHRELPEILQLELQFVSLNDVEMLELNQRIFQHDWYTDIITFELDRDAGALSAEIYLGVERAKENAKRYKNSIEEELLRLGIHGVLHLAGYEDHSPAEKKRMRIRERFFLRSDM